MSYDGLISSAQVYLPLQETSGTTASDVSGKGRNGTLVNLDFTSNSVTGPTSWLPRGLNAPGIDSHRVSVPHHPDLAGGRSVTLAGWFKPASIPSTASVWIVAKADDDDNRDYSLAYRYPVHPTPARRQTFGMWFSENGSLDTSVSNQIVSTSWMHLAMSYDIAAGQVNHYLNGKLDSTQTIQNLSHTGTIGEFSLFKSPLQTTNTEGQLAGVGMWDRVLTTNEIRHLFFGPSIADQSVIGLVKVEGTEEGMSQLGFGAISGMVQS